MDRAVRSESWKSARKDYKKTGDVSTLNALAIQQHFIAGGPAAFEVSEGTSELVLSFRPTTVQEVFNAWRKEALTTTDEARVDGQGAYMEASLAPPVMGQANERMTWGHYPKTHTGVKMTRYMAKHADAAHGRVWNPVHFLFDNGGTLITRSSGDPFLKKAQEWRDEHENQPLPEELKKKLDYGESLNTRTERDVLGPEFFPELNRNAAYKLPKVGRTFK
jgi:hypothetical protein